MKVTDSAVQKWLESCPIPVLGKVQDDPTKLHHIISISHIYDDEMLVVVKLKTLDRLKD